ncbi:bifunctional hemolysin/adenylate cyclase precursor [Roseovarius sp. A-2]|nr:bifunctional hemolysin/adenylate cyclase precursor [Roseovarius sp. A-2]
MGHDAGAALYEHMVEQGYFQKPVELITINPDGSWTYYQHEIIGQTWVNGERANIVHSVIIEYDKDGNRTSGTQANTVIDGTLKDAFQFNVSEPQECFLGDTPVHMWDGSTKVIEEITPDDCVLAHDADGTPVPGRVTKLFRNTTSDFIRLTFEDRNNLVATPGHRFLTETGDYVEIGHMLRLGGGRVRLVDASGEIVEAKGEVIAYSAATAHLFPESATKSVAFEGNAVLKEDAAQGWTTYNFEVETYHNYVAGGVRVHNDSVLSHMTPYELANLDWDTLRYDSDGAPYFGVVNIPGTNTEIQKTLITNADGTQSVVRETTASNGAGNLIYIKAVEDGNGNVISYEEKYLTGQQAGESIAGSLTPFLSHAFLGDGANVMEQIATDTMIGTVLENLGEVIGGVTHRGLIDYGDLNLGAQIDTAFEVSFEDFGGELVVNGAETAISVINQLILAEVFEITALEDTPGAIFDAVVNAGLTEILGNGLESFLSSPQTLQIFENIGLSEASIKTIENIEIGGFPSDNPSTTLNEGVVGWTGLVFTAVINEVLPDLETLEGQIASAITSAALAAFNALHALGAFAGPAGAIVGWFVGNLFDSIFDKDPQAWTNVGFDAETGRFAILETWSDDGGNVELSRSLAEAYVEGMNGFVDAIMAQSHNYSDLAQWSFGHYEDALMNAGAQGQTFADFQDTYLNAYVTDLTNIQVNDGQLGAVRVFEGIDVAQLRLEHRLKLFVDALHENDVLVDSYDVMVRQGDDTIAVREYEYAVTFRDKIIYFSEDGSDILVQEREPGDGAEAVSTSPFTTVLVNEEHGTIRFQETAFDVQTLLAIEQLTQSDTLFDFLTQSDFVTYEDFVAAFDLPEVTYDDEAIHHLVASNLQIAHDYHTYLENQDAIDALLLSAPDTALSAGWVATIAQARALGLSDPYDATGDDIDNVFYTANGDDKVRGLGGDDLIKSYGGNDILIGGNGDDTLDAGDGDDILEGAAGNDSILGGDGQDIIRGGDGNDVLIGGSGADQLVGGAGRDRAQYSGAAASVIADLQIASSNTGEAAGDIYNSIENLYGSEYNDDLRGDGQNNTIWGWHGRDKLFGRNGNDTLSGGNGNDILIGGAGADRLLGGNGHDTFRGDGGNDLMIGGAGTDLFIFKAGHGVDTITDFEAGIDHLQFEGIQYGDLSIAAQNGDALISWTGGTVRLSDTALIDLSSDDFMFV